MAELGTAPVRLVRKRIIRKGGAKASAQILEDDRIERFFRGREKDPAHYKFTPEGNLQVRGVKDVKDDIIRLTKKFVPLTETKYIDLMAEKVEALDTKEKEYDEALNELRITRENYAKGEASAEAVVQANTKVLDITKERSKIAYPEQWIDTVNNPETREVLMQYEPNEKRKMGYNVFLFKRNELGRKVAWGEYVARTSGGGSEESEESIRIRFITDINDPSTGHFHPFFQRNFVFNETEYCCPIQAYEGERFKELGKEDLRRQVLGTRSGRTIHSIAIKDKSLPNQPQKLWEDILFHFYHQHPDLRKELEETGTDKFHVMDKEVSADYGQALEAARYKLRELGENEVGEQEVKEKVITEEEQKKAKVGAIIHNFKKHF